MDAEKFAHTARSLGIILTPAQIEAFEQFEEALYEANKVVNLTRVPREECWLRHFIDSILISSLIPACAKVLDIGAGPGFPSWPLACVRQDISVTALDSNGKMLGFLEKQLLPNLKIVNGRAEEWKGVERFDVVTGRAVAPLPVQLEISAKLCNLGGFVIPMRTPSDADLAEVLKVDGLGLTYEKSVDRPLPETDVRRLFPVYKKVRPTAKKYPRPWAEIVKSPLN